MGKGTKWGIGIVVIGAIISIPMIVAATREKGTEVRVEAIAVRDLVATVNASGWIRPNRKVDVQSDIMGRITDLRVEEGQDVKAGDILLRIDPSQYEAAVDRARAALSESQSRQSQTQANLVQAQRNHQRLRQLADTDTALVSRQALEEAETQVTILQVQLSGAEFSVEQARASLSESLDRLSKTVIRATMNGTITRLDVEEGETAIVGTMNNSGSLLLTISDLSVMEAVVRVNETDIPEIEVGDSAEIAIDAFPKQRFVGRVTEISHSSVRAPGQSPGTGAGQGQAVDFEVVIRLDQPPPTLRPDLSASADVITDRRSQALSIPIIALTVRERGDVQALPQESPEASQAAAVATGPSTNDVEGVFVVRDGKAHFTPVLVGVAGREHFEVLSGLARGDSVVAGPYEAIRALRDGDAIRRLDLTKPENGGRSAAANRTGG